MIREAKREDIPICVDLIKKSFMTAANEIGIYRRKCARIYCICCYERSIILANEARMYVFEDNGTLCGYYSLLMQNNEACELNNLALLPAY